MKIKSLVKIAANKSGMMLPMVIAIISLGAGAIAYVTMSLLPKLQEEKKKAQNVIGYRIFVSSLNDYVVHGLREKWCLNKIAIDNKKIVDTDLLISTTECISGKKMHEVVTYDGNLERILWKNEIGSVFNGTCTDDASSPPILQANTILYRNCYDRGHPEPNQSPPPALTKDQIVPTFIGDDNQVYDGMKFRLTENVLQDMTDQHPLYLITKDVKKCVKDVEIEIKNVKDLSMGSEGDERKISVAIKANLYKTKLACLFLKDVKSNAYYTFYPRRLHTFSLVINKELDASVYNEFHGPVYVSGNLKIPNDVAAKNKSTIFYDTLTLGTYNDGGGANGIFKSGRIVDEDGADFTFEDRGHPYLSKQDEYPTFRGLLGGLRLDAVEDKGFYNLFNSNGTSAGNVTLLEQCIEQNKVKTTPSANNGSVLAYQNLAPFLLSDSSYKFIMAINLKNRFKNSITAPTVTSNPSYYDTNDANAVSPNPEYKFEVPPVVNGTKSVGTIEISARNKTGNTLSYNATMGGGSEVNFTIDPTGFDVTIAKIQLFQSNVNTVKKETIDGVVDSTHILNGVEATDFKQAANQLKSKCESKINQDCIDLLAYDPPIATPCANSASACDYSSEVNAFNAKKTALSNFLQDISSNLQAAGDAQLKIKMENIESGGNLVVNKKQIEIQKNSKWKFFTEKLKLNDIQLKFTAFHYGLHTLDFKINLAFVTPSAFLNVPQIVKRVINNGNATDDPSPPNPVTMSTSGNWKNLFDNAILTTDTPIDLFDLDCPDGMGLADWDTDMSSSARFAWVVANTNAGVDVSQVDHQPQGFIYFEPEISPLTSTYLSQGYGFNAQSINQFSMATQCLVSKKRKMIYGFYVCEQLIIEDGRTSPLNIVGTFIVNSINGGIIPHGRNKFIAAPTPKPNLNHPIIWRTVWDPVSANLFINHFSQKYTPTGSLITNDCMAFNNMNYLPMIQNDKKTGLEACSAVNFVEGINNFRWTTVDPDIGLATPTSVMTSQKVTRVHRWIIREDSRFDLVR